MWGLVARALGSERPCIHGFGFVSGVFYVEPPSEVSQASTDVRRGWLRFAESLVNRQPLSPRQITLKPVAGTLFLFPGYIPHRILEFNAGEEERICISFDAL